MKVGGLYGNTSSIVQQEVQLCCLRASTCYHQLQAFIQLQYQAFITQQTDLALPCENINATITRLVKDISINCFTPTSLQTRICPGLGSRMGMTVFLESIRGDNKNLKISIVNMMHSQSSIYHLLRLLVSWGSIGLSYNC